MIQVERAPKFGWYYVTGVPRELGAYLSGVPGVRKERSTWIMGVDMLGVVDSWCDANGKGLAIPTFPPLPTPTNPKLYPFQVAAVNACVAKSRRFIVFEMGLGKTPTAIEALRLSSAGNILIVCPSIVKEVWRDHLDEWWPEHPEVATVETGVEAATASAPIIICSYGLVGQLKLDKLSAVVLDESQYCKQKGADRSKILAVMLKKHAPEMRLFLTGTPIEDQPVDLWHQVNLMYPGVFGSLSLFKKRYCNAIDNPYAYSGISWKGLNPSTAPELRARFAALSDRVTKAEVAHLLPPLNVSQMYVTSTKLTLDDMLQLGDVDTLKGVLAGYTDQKLERACNWVTEQQDFGNTHVVLMCYRRRTAKKLAKMTGGLLITGEVPIKKRHKLLAEASAAPTSVLVATMHSITTGISLSAYTRAMYAEMYYKPADMAQSMARFHRINSKLPVEVVLLILSGTLEERIAAVVMAKLEDTAKVYDAGVVDGGLEAALHTSESETELLASLRDMAASMEDEDPYL
jgi:superfamily II DNA or RNA helicase